MKHTLEELQAKTDAELIELCATEVMGWESRLPSAAYRGARFQRNELIWWNKDNKIMHSTEQWNPLTDWSHTMQLLEKVRSSGEVVELTFDNGTGRYVHVWHIGGDGKPVTCQVDFEGNMQRAIVLAALLTVR